jgi:hypothetical protein
MHWIEGMIMIGAGFVPWLIATGAFPADPAQRARLEKAMPPVRNRSLMQVVALFLWAFGGFAVVNSVFGFGLL